MRSCGARSLIKVIIFSPSVETRGRANTGCRDNEKTLGSESKLFIFFFQKFSKKEFLLPPLFVFTSHYHEPQSSSPMNLMNRHRELDILFSTLSVIGSPTRSDCVPSKKDETSSAQHKLSSTSKIMSHCF